MYTPNRTSREKMPLSIWTARVTLFLQLALIGAAATAFALVALVLAGESVGPINAVLVLLLLTLLVSARFGFWPGLVAALVSDLVLFYFFFEPVLAFWANDPEHVAALALFLLVAATLGFILEAVRTLREAAAREYGRVLAEGTEEARALPRPLEIDAAEHLVRLEGSELDLTATEFKLLAFFANNAGRVLKHRTILSAVWGEGYTDDTQVLRTYVKQLRAKLGDDSAAPRFIRTETGIGYRFIQTEPGKTSRLLPGDRPERATSAGEETGRSLGQAGAGGS